MDSASHVGLTSGRSPSLAACAVFVLLCPAAARAQTTIQHGLRVPAGFEVVEYADGSLANDLYTLTIDPKGRVVVAGRGFIRTLIDDNDDGKAERAVDFAAEPKDGAMGMLWEGDTLWVTGDGGLRRFRDQNGDDKADGPPELIRAMKTGGEHTAHAIRRGPDGWLYVLCGNHAGIDRGYVTSPNSPIRDVIAGCVLRFSPDFKQCEVFAHGFRNPYDMDFNSAGELFTYDSDNERCVSLPWYEPTRFYHVAPGGHHGWLSPQQASFWRLPSYFPDVEPPVATLGRGSPTACVCYRHLQFPAEYRGSFFLADWTFGKIWHVRLRLRETDEAPGKRRFDGFAKPQAAAPEVFIESVGDNGFAPSGAAVHPATGDLFISIGGRGTRGAVYRVRYPKGLRPGLAEEAKALAPRPAATRHQPAPKSLVAKLRGLQLTFGDIGAEAARGTIWEGYTPRSVKQSNMAALATHYPTGDTHADRELLRLIAMTEGKAPPALPQRWTDDSDPIEDIHELAVWARCSNQERATPKVAGALLGLDRKITARKLNRDSHWPLRIVELYAGLAAKDKQLAGAIVAHADFGRPDHALFVPAAGEVRRAAAATFLARLSADETYPVNELMLGVLHALPAERVSSVVRPLWGEAGHDAAVVALLARQPDAVDRAKFVHGLGSPQLTTVATCLKALEALPFTVDNQEVFALLRALPQLTDKNVELRARVTQRLARHTELPATNGAADWVAWLQKRDPKLAQRLTNPDGADVPAWQKRFASIDWSRGAAPRGQATYTKASCAACHSGNQALGPDLKGVTKRFALSDLFTAIVQPSKDVSARYQLTQVETRSGKIYEGVVIYDAVDGLILQTGAAVTVRIAGAEIAARRPVARSLMPAGLLDRLSDQEIADLYAFLQGP
jgi:putative membrane-bound dehydrogenase-like protein